MTQNDLMLSLNNNIENVPMYWYTRKNTPETTCDHTECI